MVSSPSLPVCKFCFFFNGTVPFSYHCWGTSVRNAWRLLLLEVHPWCQRQAFHKTNPAVIIKWMLSMAMRCHGLVKISDHSEQTLFICQIWNLIKVEKFWDMPTSSCTTSKNQSLANEFQQSFSVCWLSILRCKMFLGMNQYPSISEEWGQIDLKFFFWKGGHAHRCKKMFL